MVIALKESVAFWVNFTLQSILRFFQLSCVSSAPCPGSPQGTLGKELDSLVTQGILAKFTEPTDWVNYLACVTKSNGTERAIKRPHYFTLTLENILPKLSGAKCFSILDARSGTLSWIKNVRCVQPLNRLSVQFSVFTFWLYLYSRHFPKEGGWNLRRSTCVTGIADDIVVYGYHDRDHDKSLRAVLQRARETGLRFNLDKCKFKSARIPFFGHIIGADGLQPDRGILSPCCPWILQLTLQAYRHFSEWFSFWAASLLVWPHSSSPLEPHQEDKWICLEPWTSVCTRPYQESDHNPYFPAVLWQYPASYHSGGCLPERYWCSPPTS